MCHMFVYHLTIWCSDVFMTKSNQGMHPFSAQSSLLQGLTKTNC